MIKILIKKLKVKCIIGLLDFERKKPQKIIVKAKFCCDDFLDYAEICKIIKEILIKNKFDTLENALTKISSELKLKFPKISYQKIKIYKPKIIKSAIVGVMIEKKY